MRYHLLRNPGHNRVYLKESTALCLGELALAVRSFESPCSPPEPEELGGAPALVLESERPLGEGELEWLFDLSFCYAVFAGENGSLRALDRPGAPYFGEEISTILKYPGKTNELFTRFLINLAASSSAFVGQGGLTLLDPVAGRGTTLFEALRLGYSAAGVEISPKSVQECGGYLKKYLEQARCKHTLQKDRLSGPNRSFTAQRQRFELARSKEEYGDPAARRSVTLIAGDSAYTDRYFPKNHFHLLVGDLALRGGPRQPGRRPPAGARKSHPQPQRTAAGLPARLAPGAQARRGDGPVLEHLCPPPPAAGGVGGVRRVHRAAGAALRQFLPPGGPGHPPGCPGGPQRGVRGRPNGRPAPKRRRRLCLSNCPS